jgi:hypothetical protein
LVAYFGQLLIAICQLLFSRRMVFYKHETVRLVSGLYEPGLPKHAEGTVTDIRRDADGYPVGVEARFYVNSKAVTTDLPFAAIEPVVTGEGGCTGVFWRLGKNANSLIEDGLHAMLGLLHHGFEMRAGLNVLQLIYDQEGRFWRKGHRLSDAFGNEAIAAGPEWDGCVVGFSGRQRFTLEFRLRGRRPPYVLLHQRWEAYQEQSLKTPDAMTLLRVMANLYEALAAECCAIPVASNWLLDEDWDSLLRQPYFPDLFILPQTKLPAQLPPLYRSQRLMKEKAMLTTLPVKFSPVDDSIERTQRELKLNQLRVCKAIGEKAYDQMYETHGSATGLYSDAKEAFYDAIRIANELGLADEAKELEKRLEHIKAVFRSQLS